MSVRDVAAILQVQIAEVIRQRAVVAAVIERLSAARDRLRAATAGSSSPAAAFSVAASPRGIEALEETVEHLERWPSTSRRTGRHSGLTSGPRRAPELTAGRRRRLWVNQRPARADLSVRLACRIESARSVALFLRVQAARVRRTDGCSTRTCARWYRSRFVLVLTPPCSSIWTLTFVSGGRGRCLDTLRRLWRPECDAVRRPMTPF